MRDCTTPYFHCPTAICEPVAVLSMIFSCIIFLGDADVLVIIFLGGLAVAVAVDLRFILGVRVSLMALHLNGYSVDIHTLPQSRLSDPQPGVINSSTGQLPAV